MWLSDAYILGIATLTVPNTAANNFKNIIIKNCGQFTNCICEINNTERNNAKDTDTVIPMYNLIEYSDNYSKISEYFKHYYRDKPFLGNSAIADF